MSSLVAKPAPDFTCAAVLPNGEIVENYRLSTAIKGKYAAIVFYPLDFTFVCPSELVALDHRVEALKERNVEVIAVSIDSQFTHAAWRKTPLDQGGIGAVRFTMAADVKHEIARAYGVENHEGLALRGTFVIDKQGLVRVGVVHDLPIGRDMDELIRVVDAIQFNEKHGEVCPAGWKKGAAGMKADAAGVASYLAQHGKAL